MTTLQTPVQRAPDRPLLGIVLLLGFCVLTPLGDGIAKILGASVSLGLLVLARFAIQAVLLVPVVALSGATLWPGRRLFWLTLLRSVIHVVAMAAMFSALRVLPLADTVAITFVMPFILLLLGWAVLGEEVGPHRLFACAVGFAGTLLVIQPNFVDVGLAALLPLLVAALFAVFMLVTRAIARDIAPVTLQALNGVQATVLLLPALLLAPPSALTTLAVPTAGTAVLLLVLGVLGTLAHLLMTWSLRFAPAATLAPMQYLEIPVATAIGWLLFRNLPNGLAAVGIAITVGAGLYVIGRERAIARRLRPAAPQVP